MINSLSLTSTCIKCVPRCGWLSSLQRQTVVTCSACFPPFCRAVSTQLGPSVYCYLGLFHHRFRTLHYLLLNFHKITVGLFFHPVQTSLKKTPTLQLTDCFPQFLVICSLVGSVPQSMLQVVNRHVKSCWPQRAPLSDAINNQLPAGLSFTNHHPFRFMVQTTLQRPNHPPIQTKSHQSDLKDTTGDLEEDLGRQVNIHYFSPHPQRQSSLHKRQPNGQA